MTNEDQKHAAEAEKKRIEQADADRKSRDQAEQQRRKEARDAPLVPDAAGNVMVECIMGPYRGQHMTMTAADGQTAINDHWARKAGMIEYEHEALDEAGRTHAFEASQAWAKAQWDAANEEPDPPPPEARKRDMAPEASGGYFAKTAAPVTKR
jgi:hypothetical protein